VVHNSLNKIIYLALLTLAGCAGQNELVVTLLHTNDVHAHVAEDSLSGSGGVSERIGGVARRATEIKRIRSERSNVLLLDAGDQFQGTLFYTHYKGESAAYFMNLLDYDAMAVGNHEFDDGPQPLADFIDQVDFPVLGANIDASAEPSLTGKIEPFTVIDVAGERIGVIGYTTPDTSTISSPGSTITFTSIVDTVRQNVADLESQGINKIIAVSHSGFSTDIAVAGAVEGLDVIISGHSHTLLSNSDPSASGDYPFTAVSPTGATVLVVSAGQHGTHLGDLQITFDDNGVITSSMGDTIKLTGDIEQDADVLAQVRQWRDPVNALFGEIVGTTADSIDGERSTCRFWECPMGNLVTDVMLWGTQNLGTQIAITNGGGIRASLDQGDVTRGDVLEVLPFGDTVAVVDLTGEQVLETIEHGLSVAGGGGGSTGRFPQVSGIQFTWRLPNAVGRRIISAQVKNGGASEELDPNKIYRVVTNSFMRTGGDGFATLEQGKNPFDFGENVDELMTQYLLQNSPVSAIVEGRISVETE